MGEAAAERQEPQNIAQASLDFQLPRKFEGFEAILEYGNVGECLANRLFEAQCTIFYPAGFLFQQARNSALLGIWTRGPQVGFFMVVATAKTMGRNLCSVMGRGPIVGLRYLECYITAQGCQA